MDFHPLMSKHKTEVEWLENPKKELWRMVHWKSKEEKFEEF